MSSMVVVEVQVGDEPASALFRASVREAIGPLTQQGLDESLGLAVRARRVRANAHVPDVPELPDAKPGLRRRAPLRSHPTGGISECGVRLHSNGCASRPQSKNTKLAAVVSLFSTSKPTQLQ